MTERASATRVIVIGGGEHARVVLDAILSSPRAYELLGFCDPSPCDDTIRMTGARRLGGDAEALALAAREGAGFVLGVGSLGVLTTRIAIATRYEAAGARFVPVVHARAWVSPSAVLGAGAFLSAGAMVNAGARLGSHTVVNTSAVIEHDVVVGDHTQIGPAAAIGGGAVIGNRTYVGLGSRVRDHVHVGDDALVGMGAVVVRGVKSGRRVVGVPAREHEDAK